MRDWHVAPDWRSILKWDSLHQHDGRGVPIGEKFEFHYPAWDVQLSRWPVCRRSLLKKLDEAVAEYEHKTRAAAETHGLIRAPSKYSPVNMEWFVLYQFAGMSSKEIADRSEGAADESTVLKGIKAAAKLIAWDTLRKPKDGRSRKIR